MDKLKPCPFCGNKDVEHDVHHACTSYYAGFITYWVFCPNCDAQGPNECNEEQAIKAWNTRSKEDV